MKARTKIFAFIILVIGIICISTQVQAAGANISTSKTTATVGDTVTISVNINAAAWNLKVSGSGVSGGSIVGYDPNGANTSTTKTYALNTSSAGTYTIYLNGDVTDGSTDVNSTVNTSITVIVNNKPVTPTTPSNGGSSNGGGNTTTKPLTGGTTKQPTEEKKSNDSSLKGLTVEGYELYPEFNANTHEYNIRVMNDITKLTITPTVNHEEASYKIQGATEELEVGKNIITIVVTAEDGSTTNYVINVIRNRETLSVQHIKFFYTDENSQIQELTLSPEFSTEVFEYDLGTISYLTSKLDIDVLANFEEAKIELTGNEDLVEGENIITITVTMPSENEEETDEVLTYKVKVRKEAEPVITFVGKIQNWFKGITETVNTWFNNNVNEILISALGVACVALAGLSVYIVIDYKKYKLMTQKIAELTRLNNARTNETINVKAVEKTSEEQPETKLRGRHF